jgi:pyridoxal/pyridoxine/pyridoxamine kinase
VFGFRQIYGKKIENENDIIEAIQECHRIGVQTVIVSSINPDKNQEKLYLYASSKSNLK